MKELQNKLGELVGSLKKRDNPAFAFFQKIIEEISEGNLQIALDKIKSCYTITQYANFNHNEEVLLDEIIEISNNI